MNRDEFLSKLRELYLVGNRADDRKHANSVGEDWSKAPMAGAAFCAHLDRALNAMAEAGVLTQDEVTAFHDGQWD